MKTCKRCGIIKDLEEFYNAKKARDGKFTICKTCHDLGYNAWKKRCSGAYRNNVLNQKVKRYGITLGYYRYLLKSQKGLCKICGKPPGKESLRLLLQIDHDHTSNTVRGLLCGNCNRGLGKFKDSPELLQKAIQYLNDSKTSTQHLY